MADLDVERLADLIMERPAHEVTHESDCPGCELAAEITAELAGLLDPIDNWSDTPAGDPSLPGDSVWRQVERHIAYVLHRRLPGHKPAPTYPGGRRG